MYHLHQMQNYWLMWQHSVHQTNIFMHMFMHQQLLMKNIECFVIICSYYSKIKSLIILSNCKYFKLIMLKLRKFSAHLPKFHLGKDFTHFKVNKSYLVFFRIVA